MVVDIKMCRFENVPWGFRLVGGADFEFPLTVVKVSRRLGHAKSDFCPKNSI